MLICDAGRGAAVNLPKAYLPNPRAGVADRQRRVGLVRLGGQKREGEECESDESFHGLS